MSSVTAGLPDEGSIVFAVLDVDAVPHVVEGRVLRAFVEPPPGRFGQDRPLHVVRGLAATGVVLDLVTEFGNVHRTREEAHRARLRKGSGARRRSSRDHYSFGGVFRLSSA